MKTNIIIQGDCIEELKKLDKNSVDAIITDPPYGLEFMGKQWDKFGQGKNIAGGNTGKDTPYARSKPTPAFYHYKISEKRDMQDFFFVWAIECLRVLKPGGFLLAMGGTRTYHRLVCGIEDAGFEIRDTIMWLYGSGFPKSLNIGKQIDKLNGKKQEEFIALGNHIKKQREQLKINSKEITKLFPSKTGGLTGCLWNWEKGMNIPTKKQWIILKEKLQLNNKFDYIIEREEAEREVTGKDFRNRSPFFSGERDDWDIKDKPATLEAKQWEGWGTALKPACEPIVVARKPLSEKNVALNVLKWGTGGINIDECRIGNEVMINRPAGNKEGGNSLNMSVVGMPQDAKETASQGRFPANIILDEEAGELMPEDIEEYDNLNQQTLFGEILVPENKSASRFFYCAKASKSERNFGCEEMEQKDSRKEDGSSKSLEIFSNQYTESSGNPTGRGITSKRGNNQSN